MYIRRKRRTVRLMHDVPLTPLIDTALTLLVIFIIAAPIMHNVIKVTLPRGEAQEGKGVEPKLVVYVDADNNLYWEGKKISLSELCTCIRVACGMEKNQVLFVKADQKASYGIVLELVDSIKVIGGVQHVALATQKGIRS